MDLLRRLKFIQIALGMVLWPIGSALSQPRNIILFIGDGMGFEQVKAASIYANGVENSLSFETFPFQGELTTYSADSSITDSAAASTAIATEFKVNNGVISMAYPGDGSDLETLLEYYTEEGKSTGLVTTTYITHATPAAFGAHEPSRLNLNEIALDYLNQTRPNVLFGGGANGISEASAEQAGYIVVSESESMSLLDTNIVTRVSGQFGDSDMPFEYDGVMLYPHLSEMTATALDILDNNPNGFFLMVEGGRIDHAGHSNDIIRNIFETIEFAHSVSVSMEWAEGRTDTLILVTADHETGGLAILKNNGKGNIPSVSWSTTGHTGVNVPVYAWGENADLIYDLMDNTDIFYVATARATSTTANDDFRGKIHIECFIASVAYGFYFEPYIVIIRKLRGHHLHNRTIGKIFVKVYHACSSSVAGLINDHEFLGSAIMLWFTPIIGFACLILNPGITIVLILLLLISAVLTVIKSKMDTKPL